MIDFDLSKITGTEPPFDDQVEMVPRWEVDEATAEIERLRELGALREKQLDTHISVIWKKDAEIERLRHQLIIEQEKVGERDSEIKRLRQMVAAVKEAVDDE